MSDDRAVKYVWAVEWENPFDQQNNRGIVFYDVTLVPGVTEEEFQKFLAEEGFPAVRGILTRAVQFNQQYLLRYEEQGPDPLSSIQEEGVAEKLGSLCKHRRDKQVHIVMGSATTSGE
jgi:hypothetical protein